MQGEMRPMYPHQPYILKLFVMYVLKYKKCVLNLFTTSCYYHFISRFSSKRICMSNVIY